jgi:hypothetical protein
LRSSPRRLSSRGLSLHLDEGGERRKRERERGRERERERERVYALLSGASRNFRRNFVAARKRNDLEDFVTAR